MIPERAGITVDSTVSGEDVAMSIDQSALAHIMNVLTDLYADAELAVLREYSTNALDSHIEAGQTRPIEVTTPSPLRPLLTIRDYGVGLAADDIRDIYSRYGASTKRTTNDAVGMLGLGCKSALAYVDQFTLAGIKDGQRMLVAISRDENGAGTMTVLEAGPTDEPDGVEISIPTDDDYALEHKARDFFSYWEPGKVLLNGAPPAALDGYAVGAYFVADRDTSYLPSGRHDGNRLTVVMGNVSYPTPDGYEHDAANSLPRDKRIIVRVPIGAVNFTPSREGLQDSPQTRAALDAALADFQPQIQAAVIEAIAQAPNRPAAALAFIEARRAFGKDNVPDLEWQGEEIPTVISAEDLYTIRRDDGNLVRPASLWMTVPNGREAARQIPLHEAGRNPWVLGYTNSNWSATQRRKLDNYVAYHGLREETSKVTYFITDAHTVPCPDWIDGAVTAINWQDVRDWRDPDRPAANSPSSGGGSYAGTYPTITEGRLWSECFPANDLPKSGRKLYYVLGDKRSEHAEAAAALLPDDAYVVCLTSTRAAKFHRLFPHARNAIKAAERNATGWYKSLSEESRLAIVLGPHLRYMNTGPIALPASKVDDPELSRLCRAYGLWESGTLCERFEARALFIGAPVDKPTLDYETICDRYPLISDQHKSTIRAHEAHAIMYVNAAYAADERNN